MAGFSIHRHALRAWRNATERMPVITSQPALCESIGLDDDALSRFLADAMTRPTPEIVEAAEHVLQRLNTTMISTFSLRMLRHVHGGLDARVAAMIAMAVHSNDLEMPADDGSSLVRLRIEDAQEEDEQDELQVETTMESGGRVTVRTIGSIVYMAQLPETVVRAMPGTPFGDYVQHPLIPGDLLVAEADNRFGLTAVTLDWPWDPVPIEALGDEDGVPGEKA